VRELLREKHMLELVASGKAMSVANAAPVAPVASATQLLLRLSTMVPGSMRKAEFLEMWGKRGFALRLWQDFVRSMELWEDSMSTVAPYNQLKILRLEEHGRYWQVWRVAYGDKLAPTTTPLPTVSSVLAATTSVPAATKNAAPTDAKPVAVASGDGALTYAKVVATASVCGGCQREAGARSDQERGSY
jgi:hypothetical protein